MKSSPISFAFGVVFVLLMLAQAIYKPPFIGLGICLLILVYTSAFFFTKKDLKIQKIKEKIGFEKGPGKMLIVCAWLLSILGMYTYFQHH